MLSFEWIILCLVILAIWLIVEVKRLKHKLFAIFLILLIVFTYISFSVSIKNNDLDLKTIDGLTKATKLYFIWMGSVLGNMKSITTHAVQMDWVGNQTIEPKNITEK